MSHPAALPLAAVSAFVLAACGRPAPSTGDATASTSEGASARITAPAADLASIAAKVVGQSAGVRENEIVQLFGSAQDLPLLEEMALEVRKRGAHPLLMVGNDKLSRRMFDEVPARYDTQEPRALKGLVNLIDVSIMTEFGEGRTFRGASPERQAAQAKTFQQVFPLMRQRGVRSVALGNGLYPTEERAEQFGVSRDDLARIMYAGLDVDYAQLEATGTRLRKALAAGKELRVTGPSGTDLRLPIAGRPVHVSDGVISAEDRKRGGTALSVWLPAGEVYLTPRPSGAEGALVVDRYFHQGDRVEGLRIDIRGGKVVGMSARSGLKALKARYDAAGEGRDILGVVDIGINPAVQVPAGSAVNLWSRAGAVTIVIGNDVWAGGGNDTDFGLAAEVPNATVTVDGTAVVEDGRLVDGAPVAAR